MSLGAFEYTTLADGAATADLEAEQSLVDAAVVAVSDEIRDTLIGMVDAEFFYALGAIVIGWLIGIGVTNLVRDAVPDTRWWKLKVQLLSVAFAWVFGGILQGLLFYFNGYETFPVVVLAVTLSFAGALFTPKVYDPVCKRWAGPALAALLSAVITAIPLRLSFKKTRNS